MRSLITAGAAIQWLRRACLTVSFIFLKRTRAAPRRPLGTDDMKGIAWAPGQDEALRAAWGNPRITPFDIAVVFDVPFYAVTHRARKLGLPRKAKDFPQRILYSKDGVTRIFLPSAGGRITLIDDDDVPCVMARGWSAHLENSSLCYVYSTDQPIRKLHRLLLNAPVGVQVDHIDRDGLNNSRSNLRLATAAENNHNRGPSRHARSAYKGVWLHMQSGLYGGVVKGPDGHRYSIGYYKSEREAARSHDAIARHFRSDFAFLNLPDEPLSAQEILQRPSVLRAFGLVRPTHRPGAP